MSKLVPLLLEFVMFLRDALVQLGENPAYCLPQRWVSLKPTD